MQTVGDKDRFCTYCEPKEAIPPGVRDQGPGFRPCPHPKTLSNAFCKRTVSRIIPYVFHL
jgi:hypothetical protein